MKADDMPSGPREWRICTRQYCTTHCPDLHFVTVEVALQQSPVVSVQVRNFPVFIIKERSHIVSSSASVAAAGGRAKATTSCPVVLEFCAPCFARATSFTSSVITSSSNDDGNCIACAGGSNSSSTAFNPRCLHLSAAAIKNNIPNLFLSNFPQLLDEQSWRWLARQLSHQVALLQASQAVTGGEALRKKLLDVKRSFYPAALVRSSSSSPEYDYVGPAAMGRSSSGGGGASPLSSHSSPTQQQQQQQHHLGSSTSSNQQQQLQSPSRMHEPWSLRCNKCKKPPRVPAALLKAAAAVTTSPGGSDAEEEDRIPTSPFALLYVPDGAVCNATRGCSGKVWQPDNYDDKCAVCNLKFSLFNRISHCRFCCRSCCSKCLSKESVPPRYWDWRDSRSAVKSCEQCARERVRIVEEEEDRKAAQCRRRVMSSISMPANITALDDGVPPAATAATITGGRSLSGSMLLSSHSSPLSAAAASPLGSASAAAAAAANRPLLRFVSQHNNSQALVERVSAAVLDHLLTGSSTQQKQQQQQSRSAAGITSETMLATAMRVVESSYHLGAALIDEERRWTRLQLAFRLAGAAMSECDLDSLKVACGSGAAGSVALPPSSLALLEASHASPLEELMEKVAISIENHDELLHSANYADQDADVFSNLDTGLQVLEMNALQLFEDCEKAISNSGESLKNLSFSVSRGRGGKSVVSAAAAAAAASSSPSSSSHLETIAAAAIAHRAAIEDSVNARSCIRELSRLQERSGEIEQQLERKSLRLRLLEDTEQEQEEQLLLAGKKKKRRNDDDDDDDDVDDSDGHATAVSDDDNHDQNDATAISTTALLLSGGGVSGGAAAVLEPQALAQAKAALVDSIAELHSQLELISARQAGALQFLSRAKASVPEISVLPIFRQLRLRCIPPLLQELGFLLRGADDYRWMDTAEEPVPAALLPPSSSSSPSPIFRASICSFTGAKQRQQRQCIIKIYSRNTNSDAVEKILAREAFVKKALLGAAAPSSSAAATFFDDDEDNDDNNSASTSTACPVLLPLGAFSDADNFFIHYEHPSVSNHNGGGSSSSSSKKRSSSALRQLSSFPNITLQQLVVDKMAESDKTVTGVFDLLLDLVSGVAQLHSRGVAGFSSCLHPSRVICVPEIDDILATPSSSSAFDSSSSTPFAAATASLASLVLHQQQQTAAAAASTTPTNNSSKSNNNNDERSFYYRPILVNIADDLPLPSSVAAEFLDQKSNSSNPTLDQQDCYALSQTLNFVYSKLNASSSSASVRFLSVSHQLAHQDLSRRKGAAWARDAMQDALMKYFEGTQAAVVQQQREAQQEQRRVEEERATLEEKLRKAVSERGSGGFQLPTYWTGGGASIGGGSKVQDGAAAAAAAASSPSSSSSFTSSIGLLSTHLFGNAPLKALPPPSLPLSICPTEFVLAELQSTWPSIFGRASSFMSSPSSTTPCVERIENLRLFQLFSTQMQITAADMRSRRHGGVGGLAQNANAPNFDTDYLHKFGLRLDGSGAAAAEPDAALAKQTRVHYLFHGTSIEAARDIVVHGFSTAHAGSSAGTWFGAHATYFSDNPSMAQGYAAGGGAVLILARVILGDVFETSVSTSAKTPPAGFDSLLGRKHGSALANREFVVYRSAMAYPEFVIHL